MRSIAIMNQKGGVGKTTTSVNLSAALARQGKKVLLIDMDPQAHASLHFGIEPQIDFPSIYDILTDESVTLAEVRREAEKNLWLIPSHLDLAAAEVELAGVVGREFILRDRLAADSEDFDYLIIDCPPSLGVLTLNALTAVQDVIIPLQPHFLALHGLSKLLQTINLVSKRLNNKIRLAGIVLCLYESATSLAKEVAGDVREFFDDERERDPNSPWSDAVVYRTKIRRNVRLAEAPSFGKSIFDYDPRSNGADDYLDLTKEILKLEKKAAEAQREKTETDSLKSEPAAENSLSMPENNPAANNENVSKTETFSPSEDNSESIPESNNPPVEEEKESVEPVNHFDSESYRMEID